MSPIKRMRRSGTERSMTKSTDLPSGVNVMARCPNLSQRVAMRNPTLGVLRLCKRWLQLGERPVICSCKGRGRVPSYDGFLSLTKRLRQFTWPRGFKLSNIDKYDKRSDPAQWLQIYSTAVKEVGGNTDVMANYLPIILTKDCHN